MRYSGRSLLSTCKPLTHSLKNLTGALSIGGENLLTILKPEPDMKAKEQAMINLQQEIKKRNSL